MKTKEKKAPAKGKSKVTSGKASKAPSATGTPKKKSSPVKSKVQAAKASKVPTGKVAKVAGKQGTGATADKASSSAGSAKSKASATGKNKSTGSKAPQTPGIISKVIHAIFDPRETKQKKEAVSGGKVKSKR